MANEITVVGAPGYLEHFRAKLIPGLGDMPARDDRGNLAVITYGDGELTVVPSSCVVTGLDLVKRLELDYDWHEESWGVRHAFGGPFIFHGPEITCRLYRRLKVGGS
jgi:hypothetical protein